MDTEIADEPSVSVMTPEAVAKQQQAAESNLAKLETGDDSTKSTLFNSMADKLRKGIEEANQPKVEKKAEPEVKADPTAAKKEEATTDAKTTEPETITGARAADWKKLKADRDEWQKKATDTEQKFTTANKELETLRSKVVATDPNPELQKQLAAIQAERDKYVSQLETVALERSERFQSSFQRVFDNSIAQAKEAAGEHAEKIEHLINMQPSKWRKEQIQKIADELPSDMDRAAIAMAITEYDKARTTRDNELKNSKENLNRLRALETEQSNRDQELQKVRVDAAVKAVVDRARTVEAFQIKDGNDAHNASVKANEMELENFLRGTLSADAISSMPIDAIEGRRLRATVLPELQNKVAELEASLKEYQSANPGAGGTTRKVDPSKPADAGGSQQPFTDKFLKAWGQ